MDVIQAWLLIGIPALTASLTLYTARSQVLGAVGVLVALGAAAAMATVDQASAVALGVVVVLLYAAGRAGRGGAVGDDPVRGPTRPDDIEGSYSRAP